MVVQESAMGNRAGKLGVDRADSDGKVCREPLITELHAENTRDRGNMLAIAWYNIPDPVGMRPVAAA